MSDYRQLIRELIKPFDATATTPKASTDVAQRAEAFIAGLRARIESLEAGEPEEPPTPKKAARRRLTAKPAAPKKRVIKKAVKVKVVEAAKPAAKAIKRPKKQTAKKVKPTAKVVKPSRKQTAKKVKPAAKTAKRVTKKNTTSGQRKTTAKTKK